MTMNLLVKVISYTYRVKTLVFRLMFDIFAFIGFNLPTFIIFNSLTFRQDSSIRDTLIFISLSTFCSLFDNFLIKVGLCEVKT